MEQPLFVVGDKVICVNSNSAQGQPSLLIEGKQYIVTDIMRCKCGRLGISVGVKENYFTHLSCGCGMRIVYPSERMYSQYRFAPIDAIEEIEEQIHQALKGKKLVTDI